MVSNRQHKAKAMKKMTSMGFPRETAKSVLNNLLRLFNNKWKFIEENNYDNLINAILDEIEEQNKTKDAIPLQSSTMIKAERHVSPKSSKVTENPGHILPEGSRTTTRTLTCSLNITDTSKKIIPYMRRSRNKHTKVEERQSIICLDHTTDDEPSCASWSEFSVSEFPKLEVPLAVMEPPKPLPLNQDDTEIPRKKQSLKKEEPLNVPSSKMKTRVEPANLKARELFVDMAQKNLQKETCCNVKPMGYHKSKGKEKCYVETPTMLPETVATSTQLSSSPCILKSNHDLSDIAKGLEQYRVPVARYLDCALPSFNYICRNVVYRNAFVNSSVSVVRDDNCCPQCGEDCLTSPSSCVCARKNGGKFSYTANGQVEEKFLDACIALKQNPETQQRFYCEDCPVERCLNKLQSITCKGHIQRKFIKECWINCGCKRYCGNRVVQNGISYKLEVIVTARKGWGLRTQDDLPKGAFVCEYIGEILTTFELHNRMVDGNAKCTHPIPLDAQWDSIGSLKDEEALFLDASRYANVARFINHRCFDANLVEIPVEVETPNCHYYHFALFTTRDVQSYEELTWDYGIDFENHDRLIKLFRCYCGSKFCRDPEASLRRKSGSHLVVR